jgi:hypothetical protein
MKWWGGFCVPVTLKAMIIRLRKPEWSKGNVEAKSSPWFFKIGLR